MSMNVNEIIDARIQASVNAAAERMEARVSGLGSRTSYMLKNLAASVNNLEELVNNLADSVTAAVALTSNAIDRVKALEEGAARAEPPTEYEIKELLQTLGQVVTPPMDELADSLCKTKEFRQTLQREIDLALETMDVTDLLNGARMTVTFEPPAQD